MRQLFVVLWFLTGAMFVAAVQVQQWDVKWGLLGVGLIAFGFGQLIPMELPTTERVSVSILILVVGGLFFLLSTRGSSDLANGFTATAGSAITGFGLGELLKRE